MLLKTDVDTGAFTNHFSSVLSSLTLEEKASLMAGVDDWHIKGLARHGIAPMRVTDCGHGVTLVGADASPATCFPTGIGMAATWNIALMEQVGEVLGLETRALGCGMLLGPKVNLHRMPLNGRCFETFSEDPWLAGLLGAAVIRGIQSQGVASCVKAMTANNQQRDQQKVSSEVDERTLRELYMRVFELAIEGGSPSAIMTSYNRLNGDYAAESRWLITRVIKGDWQYPGLVLSDWRSIFTRKVYASGLDLEMPGPGKFFNSAAVLHAIQEGYLTEADVDDHAGRVLQVLLDYADHEDRPRALDAPAHRALALKVAEESIVLLKNDDDFLPLDSQALRKILVVGPNAANARIGAGGSASVTPFYAVSPLEGIRELAGEGTEVVFLEGCGISGMMEPASGCFEHRSAEGKLEAGLLAEFFAGSEAEGTPVAAWPVSQVDYSWGWASPGLGVPRGEFAVRFRGTLKPQVSGNYRLGIYAQEGCFRVSIDGAVVVEEWPDPESENFEQNYRTHSVQFERQFEAGKPSELEICYSKRAARAAVRFEWQIPGKPAPLDQAVEAAKTADVVVICAGLSNQLEGGAHDRDSILLPEIQRRLIESITAVNPRTVVVLNNGGVLAMPWADRVKSILEAWYPGQEGGRAFARILFGQVNPSGKTPDTIPYRLEDHAAMRNYPGDGDTVHYSEGLSVGYRHFDQAGIQPHFPFGFGLSYTTFEVGAPSLSAASIQSDQTVTVTVEVRNTGARAGKEVVQIYLRRPDSGQTLPLRELRAFTKVQLEAGESRKLEFLLEAKALETFDIEVGLWQVKSGGYEVLAGPHSRSLKGQEFEVVS